MIAATLDVNVFVSAFITPTGTPHQLCQAWRDAAFILVCSDPSVTASRRAENR